MTIPKIIHQLWIGPKQQPSNLMKTWEDKHPEFEYIKWTESEIKKRQMRFECQRSIDLMTEWNGKADIMRWEILHKYGGVFIDADSICIEPIDDILLSKPCFSGYEQEKLRPGLIATGTMGFPPKHDLVKGAIDFIKKNDIHKDMAWKTVGPGLITRLYNTKKYKDLYIFPSYKFLPIHHTGEEYRGHGKVYAFQEWASTNSKYDEINDNILPSQFSKPEREVSILISSYNTKIKYINECLISIKKQIGDFSIEIIWINDGSDKLNTTLLKQTLEIFKQTTRFIKVVYYENDVNKGIGYTLNKGIEMCSNDIIMKMDSDDIMMPNRIQKQLQFMEKNPDMKIIGGQVQMFGKENKLLSKTDHLSINWEEFKEKKPHWFINHPTVCYRKSAVLEAGNYNKDLKEMAEDFELEVRMLKKHGMIYNTTDVLLYYRIHEDQVTHEGGIGGTDKWNKIRNDMIDELINT